MNRRESRLENLLPIREYDLVDNSDYVRPLPMFFSAIPMIWNFLELVVQDWDQHVTPFQNAILSSKTDGEKAFNEANGFMQVQPYYLKCLFSYVMFFISLRDTYGRLYGELNQLNRELCFVVKHRKPPIENDYVKKVKLIRDISIVHLGSEKGRLIDSLAAMSWQPMMLTQGNPTDLNKLTFGPGRFVHKDTSGNILEESVDLEIRGIHELDQECFRYIDEYDDICAEYLKLIQLRLPTKTDRKRFGPFYNKPIDT